MIVNRLCDTLRWRHVFSFTNDVTHIITKANRNRESQKRLDARSMKYFYGVLQGKWVLCYECIYCCLSFSNICFCFIERDIGMFDSQQTR